MTEFDEIGKVPQSLESERAVLGGIFVDPEIIEDIVEILKASEFYKSAHKNIYSAMLECYSHGEVIDPVLIVEKLKKMDKYEESGREEVILEIINEVSTTANIRSYAKIIKERAILRKLGSIGTEIVELANGGKSEVDDILDKAESLIFKVAESKDSKDVVSIRNILGSELERLESVYKNKGVTTGISSGFRDFDAMTSGFHPSDLVILAARPAMGKTAFALNLALNAAKGTPDINGKSLENKSVLVFSLEMSNEQLLQRLIAVEGKLGLQKIRNGFLSDQEWGHLGVASGRLANLDIHIADVPNVTVLEIRAMARRLKAAGKLDMILIDYLQLISGAGKNESRQQEISDISRALKGIARELDVPVIALSQLSRAPEQRADRRPMLSDLRDSGAIEQDADMVIFLYRDDYYNEESEDRGISEVIIGKQRNGPVGTVKLRFFHEITRFADFTTKID